MSNKRFFRFSYYVPRPKNRPLRPHQLRDGDAFAQLSDVLYSKGYRYGGLLLNYPATDTSKTRKIDTSFFESSDILVLTTRPPLNLEEIDGRSPILRSHTSLEVKIFKVLKRHFKLCLRSWVKLSKSLARKLPEEFANRADIQFTHYSGASYSSLKSYDTVYREYRKYPNLTSLYYIFTGEIWQNGPRVLCAFGVGGTDSLIWSHLLRTKFHHEVKLDRPKFIMVEIKTGKIPEKADSLSFADNWETTILLNEYL